MLCWKIILHAFSQDNPSFKCSGRMQIPSNRRASTPAPAMWINLHHCHSLDPFPKIQRYYQLSNPCPIGFTSIVCTIGNSTWTTMREEQTVGRNTSTTTPNGMTYRVPSSTAGRTLPFYPPMMNFPFLIQQLWRTFLTRHNLEEEELEEKTMDCQGSVQKQSS